MQIANTPITWPLSCILNGCRLPKAQTKPNRKATKKTALAPLPTTRELSPSSPSLHHGRPTISKGAKITEMEQSQSLLMSRLPSEVRIMIYEEVLCRPVGVVHITTRKDGKLVHFRCKAEGGQCRGLECFHDNNDDLYSTWRTRDKDLFSTWSPSKTPNMADGGLLALLQSCQQVSVSLNTCNIVRTLVDCDAATPKP